VPADQTALEEIDYLFASRDEGAVKMSVDVQKHGWGSRLDSRHAEMGIGEKKTAAGEEHRIEQVEQLQ
jgi:hypothetical protein